MRGSRSCPLSWWVSQRHAHLVVDGGSAAALGAIPGPKLTLASPTGRPESRASTTCAYPSTLPLSVIDESSGKQSFCARCDDDHDINSVGAAYSFGASSTDWLPTSCRCVDMNRHQPQSAAASACHAVLTFYPRPTSAHTNLRASPVQTALTLAFDLMKAWAMQKLRGVVAAESAAPKFPGHLRMPWWWRG